MRAEAASPPSEFPAFCAAVRTWLADASSMDPSLVAVADLVHQLSPSCDSSAEEQLANLAVDAADIHRLLGASALLSLWGGLGR